MAVSTLQAALVFSVLAAWELAVRRGWLPEALVSSPGRIATLIGQWVATGFLWPHLAATFQAMATGLLLGLLLGAALGFVVIFVPAVGDVVEPTMATLNAVPRLVFYPLLALWLGLGIPSKAALVVTIVLFVGFFNTLGAIREIDRQLVAQVRVLGARPRAMLRHLYVPATLLWIMTSLRTSVGLAFIGAILGEYMGPMRGIGNVIMGAQNLFRPDGVMAGLIVTLALAGVIDAGLQRMEARWSAWRQGELHER